MNCKCDKNTTLYFEECIKNYIESNDLANDVSIISSAKTKFEELLNNKTFEGHCNDCENCLDQEQYIKLLAEVSKLNRDKDYVKEWYYYWKKAERNDQLRNIGLPKISENDFNLSEWTQSNKKLIYFDLNVINQYIENKEINNLIELSKEMFTYVYSPNHIFEVFRMNSFDRLDWIRKLTGNVVVLPKDHDLEIYLEDPKYSMDRINKKPDFVPANEDYWFYEKGERELYFSQYNDIELRKRVGSTKDVFEEFKSDFDKIMLRRFAPTIDQIRSGINNSQLDNTIDGLYYAMNILSFKCDNDERKYKSGLYDAEHLKYALKCDYLVTRDKKFYERTRAIYQLMRIETEVLYYDEFCKMLLDNFA